MTTANPEIPPPSAGRLRSLLLPAIIFLPLAFLWFVLINHLRVEWTLNPQYNYGWAVPFLCVFLIWQKSQTGEVRGQKPEGSHPAFGVGSLLCLFGLLALLYAPTRLVQEANPDWRFVSWTLAIEVIGLTFCVLRLGFSTFHISAFVFPLCFFLVAVPWPTFLEQSLIQWLTQADADVTCELLGWLGIPAIPHGNVIEVVTGEVGIDEACSGIRSFQATLMISLFLGEFYALKFSRRMILVLSGFAMSFLFNLARMFLLVWVAAHKGIPAIASWHDPAGVTILVACFCGLWGLGEWFGKKQKTEKKKQSAEILKPESGPTVSVFRFSFALALLVWILAVEVSVEWWYCSHEARLPAAQQWTVVWPADQTVFKELPIPDAARQILRYDEGRSAIWQEDGLGWQAIFLRWNPGRTAVHLAQNHTPEVCLTAAGHKLDVISELRWFDVNGLRLPFSIYEVTDATQPVFVFYCLWDDRASAQGFETVALTRGRRLAPVLAGLRNPGQRSFEIAVRDAEDAAAAETALRLELEKIVVVTK